MPSSVSAVYSFLLTSRLLFTTLFQTASVYATKIGIILIPQSHSTSTSLVSLVNSQTTKNDFHLSLIHFRCWTPGLHPSSRFPNGPPSNSMLTTREYVWSTGLVIFFTFFHFGWFLIGWMVIAFRITPIFLKVSHHCSILPVSLSSNYFHHAPCGLHVWNHLLFLWVNCSHLPFFGLANSSYLKAQLRLCLFHLSCSPPGRLLAPHLSL